jgi:fructoselysine 6-kinase
LSIITIGDCVVDKYIDINKEFIGGSGLNTAIILKKYFDLESEMMGIIGNDDNGKKILKYLKKYNFDLSKIKVLHGKTAVAYIENIGDDYSIKKVKQGVKGKYKFKKQDILVVKNYYIVHTNIYSNTIEYLSLLKSQNEIISFDYSFKLDFNQLNKYSDYIDILFVNGAKMSNQNIEFLKGYDIKYLIITYGKKGFTVINGTKEIHRKPKNDNIVDSIGAGDTLISTFLAGIYNNKNLNFIANNLEYNAYQSCLNIGPYHQDVESQR